MHKDFFTIAVHKLSRLHRKSSVPFLLLLLFGMPLASRAQVKIMPLGNSITQSNAQHNSYRRALWFKLKNGGYSVDFVGSQTSNYGGPPLNPDFDMDSEGHWGWRADELLGSIAGWAATYRPDVVLMHVGSNDMIQGQTVESTISEIGQIIDRLQVANPNVKILMAKLIPTTLGANANITALNNALPSLASQKTSAQSSVTIVDQNTGFNAATDTFDGVHTTEGGEEKMAAKWYQALQSLLAPAAAAPQLRAPENPAATSAGLAYQYYEGSWSQLPTFAALTPSKAGTVTTVDLGPRNRDDDFAMRYTGYLEVPADGEYTFYTASDDGSQLFIGSTLVVDNNGLHGNIERSGKIGLQQGKHAITVTFFERNGDQVLAASYEGPGIGKKALPAAALYREAVAATPSPTLAPVATTSTSFYRAINLNGPALTLDGNAWESGAAANFSPYGYTFENQSVSLLPATDAERARMIRSSVWGNNATLTLKAVPSGTYEVYLYVWEDNYPAVFSVRLENNLVLNNYNSGSAGTWKKLGPYRTAVTDGTLNLTAQGGDANLSGLEVWRVNTSSATAATASSAGLDVENRLQLYPNPSANQVFLGLEAWSQAVVRDNLGQVRLTQASGQAATPLSTAGLPNGIYTVEARTATGQLQRSTLVVAH